MQFNQTVILAYVALVVLAKCSFGYWLCEGTGFFTFDDFDSVRGTRFLYLPNDSDMRRLASSRPKLAYRYVTGYYGLYTFGSDYTRLSLKRSYEGKYFYASTTLSTLTPNRWIEYYIYGSFKAEAYLSPTSDYQVPPSGSIYFCDIDRKESNKNITQCSEVFNGTSKGLLVPYKSYQPPTTTLDPITVKTRTTVGIIAGVGVSVAVLVMVLRRVMKERAINNAFRWDGEMNYEISRMSQNNAERERRNETQKNEELLAGPPTYEDSINMPA